MCNILDHSDNLQMGHPKNVNKEFTDTVGGNNLLVLFKSQTKNSNSTHFLPFQKITTLVYIACHNY